MENLQRIFLSILFLGFSIFAFGQDNDKSQDTQALLKQGVDLQNAGKYPEAIEKYSAVLKAEPENSYASYATAYSLYASKKPDEAIPFLEKSIKTAKPNIQVAAYSLLGTIYDESKQTPKAIAAYNEVIKLDPNYQQVYYNIGIAYSRNQQYAEAETSAIEAIKRDPKNANDQRLYALACFHQNKRANALLGFCNFILLEPNGARSAETYNNIRSILTGGVIKQADGSVAVARSKNPDNEADELTAGISKMLKSLPPNLQGADLLEYQLKTIFILAGQSAEKRTDKTFFDKFYAGYFYKLAQSNNLPAFARMVSLSANKDENTKWQQEHMQAVSDLDSWVKNTERGF